MALIVQKFGGTSVGTLQNIQHVAAKIIKTRAQGHEVVVVVSAMNGETDRLTELAKAIQRIPDPREYAVLVTTGEKISIALLAMALINQGCPARSFTGAQAQIRTDSHHKKAHILEIECAQLRNALVAGHVPVVAGFQGISADGDITTLGRGGSDTTAVALAAALQADECQIYTDVDGVYTADPRIVPKAHCLEQITFAEMFEFASLGAKVLQQRAVEFAGKHQIPLRVLSTFNEGRGTLIRFDDENDRQSAITGIAFSSQEAKLSVMELPQHPHVITEILAVLQAAHIDVDMLTQQMIAPDSMGITFTLSRDDYFRALEILPQQVAACKKQALIGDTQVAKLSLVGVGLRSHPAIMGTLFETLEAQGILAQLVSTSEVRVSVIIHEKDAERGMRALHTACGLDSP
jgi:aspartate kinase